MKISSMNLLYKWQYCSKKILNFNICIYLVLSTGVLKGPLQIVTR